MSKNVKKIKHKNTKRMESSSRNILQAVNEGRDEVKSLQKSLANHRQDVARYVLTLVDLLRRTERIKYDRIYF